MTAEESLRAGNTDEALAQLQQEVRGKPADASLRVFLFQLLAVQGQWNRALKQLSVAGELDAAALPMVQTYREALRCEALRAEVFAGRRTPLVFGDPAPWVALLVEALRLGAEGRHDESQVLRERAFEAAPVTSGTVDGKAFEWIADADGRLGPVLEAVVNGRYYWIPFDRVQKVHLEEPADLRDLVWMPAHLTWANEGESVALLPARYPGSEVSENALVQLGRTTEWQEGAGGLPVGLGQRMWCTDTDEFPIMDVRHLVLEPAEAVAPEGGAIG